MRHRKAGTKFGRTASHRQALFRNLVTSLLDHESIETTDAKAKELRRWADKMITLAKEGSLHSRRQALSVIRDKAVVRKLFSDLAPRFQNREGGYTRVVKTRWRHGDGAPMSIIALVGDDQAVAKKALKKKEAKAAKATQAAKSTQKGSSKKAKSDEAQPASEEAKAE